jgi:hypothetical protein
VKRKIVVGACIVISVLVPLGSVSVLLSKVGVGSWEVFPIVVFAIVPFLITSILTFMFSSNYHSTLVLLVGICIASACRIEGVIGAFFTDPNRGAMYLIYRPLPELIIVAATGVFASVPLFLRRRRSSAKNLPRGF